MQDLSIIESAHAAKVLVLCLREGDMPKGMIYQKIPKNKTVLQSRIKELVDAGLLNEEEKFDPFRKIISLTPKGRKVAEHLAAIEGILREEP
jgi:DNA-binding HxlR family transcriptional regulator